MKRVLIFSVAYHPFVGGAEIAVKEITDRISPEEIVFDMLTVNLDGKQLSEERIGNVTVYRVGKGTIGKFLFPIRGYIKAKSLEKKLNEESAQKYDAIWSIMASQASIAAAFFKMRNKDKKLVLTLQEGDEEKHLMRYVSNNTFLYSIFIKPLHELVFKYSDRITVISSYLKERALRHNVTSSITIIPNGVNVELFREQIPETELQDLKKELDKKPDDIFLVTTSRLVTKNAVSDIISALSHLPEKIKLLIIGEGSKARELERQVQDLRITGRVIFAGQIPYHSIPKYLKISDIFIRPSLSEGFGNSFIEAMAAGVPVIATPVGGIRDFLFDPLQNPNIQPTGLFCEVNNPKSIAEKVTTLLHNKQLREKIVLNAQKMVTERYDWNLVAGEMKMVLNEEYKA